MKCLGLCQAMTDKDESTLKTVLVRSQKLNKVESLDWGSLGNIGYSKQSPTIRKEVSALNNPLMVEKP